MKAVFLLVVVVVLKLLVTIPVQFGRTPVSDKVQVFEMAQGRGAGLEVLFFPELDADKVLDRATRSCLCQCIR